MKTNREIIVAIQKAYTALYVKIKSNNEIVNQLLPSFEEIDRFGEKSSHNIANIYANKRREIAEFFRKYSQVDTSGIGMKLRLCNDYLYYLEETEKIKPLIAKKTQV